MESIDRLDQYQTVEASQRHRFQSGEALPGACHEPHQPGGASVAQNGTGLPAAWSFGWFLCSVAQMGSSRVDSFQSWVGRMIVALSPCTMQGA